MDLGSGQTSRVSVVELGTRYVRRHWVVTAEASMRGGRKDLGQQVGKEGEGHRDTSDLKQNGLGDRLNIRRENAYSAKDNWFLLAEMDSSGDCHGFRAQWGWSCTSDKLYCGAFETPTGRRQVVLTQGSTQHSGGAV